MRQVQLELLGLQVQRELLVLLVRRALLVLQARLVLQVPRVLLGPLEQRGPQVLLVLQARRLLVRQE